MAKGNDGRGRRRLLVKRLTVVFGSFAAVLAALKAFGLDGSSKSTASTDIISSSAAAHLRSGSGNNNNSNRSPIKYVHVTMDDKENLDLILSASVHLVDISVMSHTQDQGGSYDGIVAEFCRVDFSIHKNDPSSAPMFRQLVEQSPQCGTHRWTANLKDIVEQSRQHDGDLAQTSNPTEEEPVPKSMDLTGVVFHESRCGSTLVANSLIAMNPDHHRVYSESGPPLKAMGVCGENFQRCSKEHAANILEDVIYLMSRTNDAEESRVFFKIQSAGTKYLSVFRMAFPSTPWIFVYRDPVQVLMSHLAQGKEHANCVRQKKSPPTAIRAMLNTHGHSRHASVTYEEYCAAHLANICDNAVSEISDSEGLGTPVNYIDLPDILYNDVFPNNFGMHVGEEEIVRIMRVSSHYSKGAGNQAKEWKEDSAHKDEHASEEIMSASDEFLQESFDLLQDLRQEDIP